MKSILKKIKKGLGKAAKVALPVGAALLAAKAMKRRNADVEMDLPKSDIVRTTLNKMTSNDAYSDDTMPGNLSRSAGKTGPKRIPQIAYGQQMYKSGGRAVKKSKPKSIGKALRGGGKVIR